jgi:hypothetical protein
MHTTVCMTSLIKNMNKISLIAAVLLALGMLNAQATPKKAKEKEAAPAKEVKKEENKPNFLTVPLTLGQSFPPQFLGVDPRAVVGWADRLREKRGEFESSAAYEKRVTRLKTGPIVGSIRPGDPMAFVNKVPHLAKYDADQESMRVELSLEEVLNGYDKTKQLAFIAHADVKQSTYTGSNAYGATTEVIKYETKTITVIPEGKHYGPKVTLNFTIPAEKAKEVKPNLAVAYVGTVIEPVVFRGTSHISPTRSLPFDLNDDMTSFSADIKEIIVFDFATGEILLRDSVGAY